MARLVTTPFVACLLGATAAAFAVTQGLKQEQSPIYATRIAKLLGPSKPAELSFKLRRRETMTVTVVGGGGNVVRTLVDHEPHRAGVVRLPAWDGRTDAGALAAAGVYHLRVALAGHGSTRIPSAMRLDTAPPALEVTSEPPAAFSPDRDGHVDRVLIRYTTDEPTRALLTVNGHDAVRARPRERRIGVVAWAGRAAGEKLPPGRYTLRLRLADAVGNVSAARVFHVRLRYIDFPRRLVAQAGARFRVRLDTDTRTVRWRFAGRSGLAQARSFRLRAPAKPGRYVLRVAEPSGKYAVSTIVVVR